MAVRRSLRSFRLPLLAGVAGRGSGLGHRRHVDAIQRLAHSVRGRHLFVLDICALVVAALIAVAIPYDSFDIPGLVPGILPFIAMLVVVRTVANIRFGLYNRSWSFASVPDLQRIVGAVSLGTLICLGICLFVLGMGAHWPFMLPNSFWLAEIPADPRR